MNHAEPIQRIALGLEYKGSRYRGWQRQPEVPSVQREVENALSKVAAEPIEVLCAGRTDAGVHASGQVVHFDSNAKRPLSAWVMGANAYLPPDISIAWAEAVPQHFHARFSAVTRRYRYVIYNDLIRPAHLAEEVTWNHRPLNIETMRKASRCLLGRHDFSAFRASGCQAKSPIKYIEHLELIRFGQFIVLDIRADAFLHHMVRNIAGVLMAIGSGHKPVDWADEVLQGRERKAGGVTAHPHGLYLVQVEYPAEFILPRRYLGPHFLSALRPSPASGRGA